MPNAVSDADPTGSHSLLSRAWGLRKPRRLASVVLRRLGFSRYFTIKTSGVRLRFHPAVWPIFLWENPNAFGDDTAFLQRYLRPGDVVIDAGANVGLLTLISAATVGKTGTVYSIEAHPQTYRFLVENIALNKATNIQHFNVALGDRAGTVSFSNGQSDDGNHVVASGPGLAVNQKKLDDIVESHQPVALLKMDVEGYEKFVLDGAVKTLATTECIYFESSEMLFKRYGYTCKDLFLRFTDSGFVVLRVKNHSVAKLEADYSSSAIENLVAVRSLPRFLERTGYTLVD